MFSTTENVSQPGDPHQPQVRKGRDYRAYVHSLYSKVGTAVPGTAWKLYTPADFDSVPDHYPQHGDYWGNWRFDAERLVLEYAPADNHWWYEIDLERVHDSASLLDWIFQLTGKARHCCSTEDLGDMLEALEDLFHTQANLCSFGINKQLKATKYLRSRLRGLSQKRSRSGASNQTPART